MDDFLEIVAARKHQGAFTFLYFVSWFFLVIFGLIALMMISTVLGTDVEGGFVFRWENLIIGAVFGCTAFLLWRRADYCRVEYDYTFTNGTLDVSQVLNNKRRRYLTALDTKNVTHAGPVGNPVFRKLIGEKDVKKHNWFLNRDGKLYYFLFAKNNVKHLAIVELNDEMIEMIRNPRKKYLAQGVWADEDGKTAGYGIPR